MENTIENKMKFFALHWGQEVLKLNEESQLWNIFGFDDEEGNNISETSFLELKPLSSITNEDAIWVAKIFGLTEDLIFNGKILVTCLFDNSESKETYLYNSNVEAVDYLRLNGYAVQWNKITVKKQIEYGWVKLKY